jgi:hypothetical protein
MSLPLKARELIQNINLDYYLYTMLNIITIVVYVGAYYTFIILYMIQKESCIIKTQNEEIIERLKRLEA